MRQISWQVDLEVDARDEMLLIVRLATSGAATRAGIDYEGVEECKTAVNEACYYLINAGSKRIYICYKHMQDRIRIDITGKDDISSDEDKEIASPLHKDSSDIGLCVLTEILRELADHAEIHDTSIELERMI